jgi:drug/metabolite transporter (DMT)-like permease
VSVLAAARATRIVGAASTLGWIMVVGLVVAVPIILLFHRGSLPQGKTLIWLAVAGITNVLGLRLEYSAMATGKVGTVTQISSTEGMITAILAVIAGEHLRTSTAVCCGVIVAGVVLATRAGSSRDPASGAGWITLAIGGALFFGLDLYALAKIGLGASIVYALLPARLVGAIGVAAPMASRHELRLTRSAAPLVLLTGTCEVFGVLSYTAGSRANIAVAAVMTAQFPALAAIGAFVLYHEHLRSTQVGGLALSAAGVTALSLLK